MIHALRAAFLSAGRLTESAPPAGTRAEAAEAIEARNMTDGRRLLDAARRTGPTRPSGTAFPAVPPTFAARVEAAIDDWRPRQGLTAMMLTARSHRRRG